MRRQDGVDKSASRARARRGSDIAPLPAGSCRVHGQISEHIDGRNLPGFSEPDVPGRDLLEARQGDRVRFGRGGSAVFSALAGVVQRTVQITVSLLIMPLLINALGKSSFGIWAAAASVTWMGAILDLGVGGALVTVLSRMLASGQTAPARRLVTTALWLGAMIAAVELCGALLIIPRIAPAEAAEAYQLAVVFMA